MIKEAGDRSQAAQSSYFSEASFELLWNMSINTHGWLSKDVVDTKPEKIHFNTNLLEMLVSAVETIFDHSFPFQELHSLSDAQLGYFTQSHNVALRRKPDQPFVFHENAPGIHRSYFNVDA